MNKKIFVITAVLIVLGFVVYYFAFARISSKKFESEKVFEVKKQDIFEDLVLSGEVKAERHAILHFKNSGKLVWVGVKEGDQVKKGQAIASLDKIQLEKEFRKYMNYYLKTRWDFEQTKDDYKDFEVWGISEEEKNRIKRIVEKAQFDLDNSVLDVEIKNLALQESVLTAPFSGVVAYVESPNPGVFITPTEAEFEIVDPESIYFEISADQTEVIYLKEGMQGKIVLDVYPEEEFEGVIKFVSFVPKEGETGAVYKVKVSLPEALVSKVKIGMTGDFDLKIGEKKQVLAIPLSYLQSDDKGDFVYLYDRGKIRKQYVEGESFAEYFVIKKGLKSGDKVIETTK